VIVELMEQAVELDDDVLALDQHTWVLHGRIAYDGEIIVARFGTEREARAALRSRERA
jgi:hypothetical protein